MGPGGGLWRPRKFSQETICKGAGARLSDAAHNQVKQTKNNMSDKKEEQKQAEQAPQTPAPAQAQVQVDTTGMKSGYANVVGIAANINEVYLTFGVNSDPYNPTPSEPVKLDNRVIMTPDAAKRLCLNLNATLAAFEQRFGVIELDLQKRIRS